MNQKLAILPTVYLVCMYLIKVRLSGFQKCEYTGFKLKISMVKRFEIFLHPFRLEKKVNDPT